MMLFTFVPIVKIDRREGKCREWSRITYVIVALIFFRWGPQGTASTISTCGSRHIIFICLLVAPLWNQTVPIMNTSVKLYGP